MFYANYTRYKAPIFDPNGENIICYENTVLFLVSSFQYILVAVVFSVGPPYRKPLWTNKRLIATLCILITLTCWFVLMPPSSVLSLMELRVLPFKFKIFILFLGAANLGISLLCEKYLFTRFASAVSKSKDKLKYMVNSRDGYSVVGKQHKKIYKKVMDDMGIHGNK